MILRFLRKEFWTFLFATGLACALNIIMYMSGLVNSSPKYQEAMERFSSLPWYQLVFLALIVAPVIEETIFRGVFFGLPKYAIKLITGRCHMRIVMFLAVFSSLLFGIYHGNVVQGIYAFLMGMGLCYTYECCGGLFWSMTFHFFANSFSIIAGSLVNQSSLLMVKIVAIAVSIVFVVLGEFGLKRIYYERLALSLIKERMRDGEIVIEE